MQFLDYVEEQKYNKEVLKVAQRCEGKLRDVVGFKSSSDKLNITLCPKFKTPTTRQISAHEEKLFLVNLKQLKSRQTHANTDSTVCPSSQAVTAVDKFTSLVGPHHCGIALKPLGRTNSVLQG